MYPLAFSLSPSLPVYARSTPTMAVKDRDVECVEKVWTTPISLRGSFLGTRTKAPSIRAEGIVHVKESVISGEIICSGSMTSWYSEAQDVQTGSGVSLIGCKVADVVARTSISCKNSMARSLTAHTLIVEESTISRDVTAKDSMTIDRSTIQGCIRYGGAHLVLRDSTVGSIVMQKNRVGSASSTSTLPGSVVCLHDCRVLGAIVFESGRGKVISQGSAMDFISLNGKTWVQKSVQSPGFFVAT